MAADIEIKGVSFLGFLTGIKRGDGPEALARVLAEVPGPGGEALRHGEVLAGGWYPVVWYKALLTTIEQSFPDGRAHVRALSRAAVVGDFSTLFRLVSLVVSPESALKNAVRVMSKYFKGGTVEVVSAGAQSVRYRFAGFYGFDSLCWADTMGGMEGVLVAMRTTDPTVRIVEGGTSDWCVAEATWKK